MGVIGLGCVRSCGVTTIAAGLASCWPGDRVRLLVEADPAGGTLAGAAGWPPEPGLVSLAAAARRDPGPELVFEHCQALPGGTPVLAGPASPSQARSALSMLLPLFGRFGELDAVVLLDCGRLDPGTAGLALLARADLALLVTRPRLADLHSLSVFLQAHGEDLARPVLVLVGRGPYPPSEVAGAFGVEVAAHLPWDPEAAEVIATTPVGSRVLTRTPLVRALRSLAEDLARRIEHRSSPAARERTASAAAAHSNGVAPRSEADR